MKSNTALEFVESINQHDLEKINALLTDDHLFIDSQGGHYQGKEVMTEAWNGYFVLFPDYRIDIEEIVEKDSLISLFGFASATYTNKVTNSSQFWRIPAAWKAIVVNNMIKLWQVYADNSIVISIVKGETI